MKPLAHEKLTMFVKFDRDLKPLMERFERLDESHRKACVESMLGAYIQEAEKANGGNIDAACGRAIQMFDTLLKRVEGHQITLVVGVNLN